jgi:cysteine desulfurase/selenocysteine lyase
MSIDWENIRNKEFPATSNSIQLKSGGGSPISKSAYEAAKKYYDDMLNYGDIFWIENLEKVEEVRSKIAEYLNSKKQEIGLLINSSSCMKVVLHYLDHGEVLYPEQEFPTSIHDIKRAGFKTRPIIPTNNRYPISEIKKSISRNTSSFITSHIQYLTGYRQNLEETGNLCKNNNITHIVNATQSFGVFPIDVTNCNIDLLVASGLKWACAGYGIGILYIKKELVENREMPNLTGWLSVEDPYKMDPLNVKLKKNVRAFDAFGGAPHFPQIFALGGSLSLLEKIGDGDLKEGIKLVSSRIIELTKYLDEQLAPFDFNSITPLEEENRSGIFTIKTPNAQEIAEKLEQKKIFISCRRNPKTGEKTHLRISLNFYNNTRDIDALIEELGRLRYEIS